MESESSSARPGTLIVEGGRPPCSDCGKCHIRRRLICAVDGTWMVPDGVAGQETENASNVARIVCAVKEGIVTDADGERWYQHSRYWAGVGSETGWLRRQVSGALGTGLDSIIGDVYRFCAENCCPTQDEIFFFGFSRGAIVVRAVASLFNYLHTLKPDLRDFETRFRKALRLYKKLTDKTDIHRHQHEQYLFLSQNTLAAPTIKFMGLFDSVMGTADAIFNKNYELGHVECVWHIRHALALLEKRWIFRPTRFLGENAPPGQIGLPSFGSDRRSCLEAWFLGRHGNMGGASATTDGLSLWPLQWVLGEAELFGLILGHNPDMDDRFQIREPLEYVRPEGGLQLDFRVANGCKLRLWGLGASFVRPGFDNVPDEVNFWTAGPPLTYHERPIFTNTGELVGYSQKDPHYSAFIHPSIALHSNSSPEAFRHLNKLQCVNQIRKFIDENIEWPSMGSLYSTEVEDPNSRARRIDGQYLRVLVCGATGAGKSSLINGIARESLTTVGSEGRSVEHNIERELGPCSVQQPEESQATYDENPKTLKIFFHDSRGFEHSTKEQINELTGFLEDRQKRCLFREQIHCIWYCVDADSDRMFQDSDAKLLETLEAVSGLSIIIVFTKCDKLEMTCAKRAALHVAGVDQLWNVPAELQGYLRSSIDLGRAQEEARIRARIPKHRRKAAQSVFVNATGHHPKGLDDLIIKTRLAMTTKSLMKIYNKAVKSSLDKIISKAAAEALRLVRRERQASRGLLQRVLPAKNLGGNFLSDLQERLVGEDLFNIELPDVPISDSTPSALFGPDKKAHPIADVLAVKAVMVLATFNGVVGPMFTAEALLAGHGWFGAAVAAGVSAAAYSIVSVIDTRVSYHNSVRMLVSAASAILLLERVFWYGERTPSLSQLTRSAVLGIQQMPQLLQFCEEAFGGRQDLFGTHEEVRIFRAMVERFRVDYQREFESQDKDEADTNIRGEGREDE